MRKRKATRSEIIERNEKIVKDYENGLSFEELSEKYGLCIRTCYRALDEERQAQRIAEEQDHTNLVDKIVAEYQKNTRVRDIAEKYGVSVGYCSAIAVQAGISNKELSHRRITRRQQSSNRRIALICPKCGYGKNGEWRPSIAGACRTGGGCPACSGKVLVEGVNDVATVHPEIAAQWHPTLNEFPPTRVTSGSAKHVYLVCKDCGYGANGEWHPMIAFACGSGGCHRPQDASHRQQESAISGTHRARESV